MALLDVISYTLSSKIAESAVSGVDSMSVDGTTLKINCVDGNLLEMDFPAPKDGKDGADGVSVVDIDMNEEHELIFIMSDGSQIAAGKIDVIKGDKGDQGEKGDKGDTGYSPSITENAANTEDNYKLDITNETNAFTTPNLKGRPGVQGLQGVRGEKGDKGDIGLTGEKGADGVSPTVIENADNSDVTYKLDITDANGTHTTPNLIGKQGPQGLKGDKGDKGDTGSQGIAGEAGADGVSPLISSNTANTEDIYKLDITDANGTFTTPNLIGRQGPQGIQGEVGPQGEQGIQGIQGIQGEKGEDGYPFLIYREYASIDDFDPDHFPEIGLMFMIKAEEGQSSYPIYRYTGMSETPYSFVTDLATSEGLKGEKGEKGDQGEQGIQGEKGTDGITYTPVIGTVTTVDSMSDAAADIVIDSEAKTATFNFSLPKGANGAIGGKGDKGTKGDTGEKGEDGADGITYTPVIGTVTTVDSASEAAASVDVDSENARATFNFSIPRGQNGLQGIQGEQGPQGIQGEAGKDGIDGTTYTPAIGTVTTVDSNEEASASVSTTMDDAKLAVFDFNIPRGVGIAKIEFTSSTLGDVAGIAGATDTYTITYTDASTSTYEVYNGKDCDVQIDDENASETSVWSSKKTSDELAKKVDGAYTFGTAGATQWLKLTLGNSSKFQPIIISDQYGGKVEITGMADDGTYKSVKLVRYSYGDWTTYSATDYTVYDGVDPNYKIQRLYYYPTNGCYYLEIRQWCTIKVSGATTRPEMVTSLPAEKSEMTSIPESQFASKSDLAAQTANRKVKTFDNTNSTTEKWYKICSALTGGVGCNIKLTASRADSTATVQYFSALFRDSRYRYTSSYMSRERTVYESMLIAEYSAYIIADANNDIWVHVPSYGKAIIEIDTRAITIDGTVGTPVKDYVYSSFEHQYDGRINDSATSTDSTWSSSKIASEINPTIDVSKVFSNGALNIATLCSTYGNGRYVIVGQGTAGNGSATIDIWTLVGNAISYIVNATYSNRTSNMFTGYTYDNPTINFETGYINSCNHIAKVCTLA